MRLLIKNNLVDSFFNSKDFITVELLLDSLLEKEYWDRYDIAVENKRREYLAILPIMAMGGKDIKSFEECIKPITNKNSISKRKVNSNKDISVVKETILQEFKSSSIKL